MVMGFDVFWVGDWWLFWYFKFVLLSVVVVEEND